jgi:rhodanese-related sulfurtransferase
VDLKAGLCETERKGENMKKLLGVMVLLLIMVGPAAAAGTVKAEVFKEWLRSGKPVLIVDIQPAGDYEMQHFKGSLETNAFPAKTDEEKKRLDGALGKARSSKDPVLIVCPRGRSGANNTYEYLKASGIPDDRLFILEGGIAGWPYPALFQKGR